MTIIDYRIVYLVQQNLKHILLFVPHKFNCKIMNESNISPNSTAKDNIQEKMTDALANFIKGIVKHSQKCSNEGNNDELKAILQDVRDSLKKQVQINHEIHDELISSQHDSIRRTLLNPVIGIHDLMEENLDYIINKMPQEFEKNVEGQLCKVIELYIFIKSRIKEMLTYSSGLRIIEPSEGELFDPNEHFIVRTEPTSDKALENTVCRLEKAGFKDARNGSIFKQAEVIVKVYTEESHADTNNLTNK